MFEVHLIFSLMSLMAIHLIDTCISVDLSQNRKFPLSPDPRTGGKEFRAHFRGPVRVKGDALDHIRPADVHIAASAQAYRCEGAGIDSQPFLTDTFLHGEL
jgi:hypothetical protein